MSYAVKIGERYIRLIRLLIKSFCGAGSTKYEGESTKSGNEKSNPEFHIPFPAYFIHVYKWEGFR